MYMYIYVCLHTGATDDNLIKKKKKDSKVLLAIPNALVTCCVGICRDKHQFFKKSLRLVKKKIHVTSITVQ